MDLGIFGSIEFSMKFLTGLLTISLIDIILAGDNAVVIAMAVKNLPTEKKYKGIILGSLAAVVLRVIFTFIAAQLLLTPLIKLIGGGLVLWIAIKLITDDSKKHIEGKGADSVWNAVWIIIIADFTMSLDNVLAVACASHGNLFLLLFGLALSIPLVVFTSSLLSKLMDKYPIIMWIGAGVLGKVGGEMIISDSVVVSGLLEPANLVHIVKGVQHPLQGLIWGAEITGIIFVISVAWLKIRYTKKKSV